MKNMLGSETSDTQHVMSSTFHFEQAQNQCNMWKMYPIKRTKSEQMMEKLHKLKWCVNFFCNKLVKLSVRQ